MKMKEYARSFNSYSGTDMVAAIHMPGKQPIVFGNLASISYSVYRAKYPVLTLGRITPKGFTRGIRSITGQLVFLDFDESIVFRCLTELKQLGYKCLMDELPMFDITISMANEYGNKSKLMIYGVTTTTEGKQMNVDQLQQANAYDFFALDVAPLTKV